MADKENQILDFIIEKCKEIKYGEWEVKLTIHNKELVGLDDLKPPMHKIRMKKLEK